MRSPTNSPADNLVNNLGPTSVRAFNDHCLNAYHDSSAVALKNIHMA